jgi:DNA polymerase-3 subunit epsilon
MDRPIVAFGVQTAAVSGAPHLIELGAVRVVEGEITDQLVSFCLPEVPIEDEGFTLHGISDADVRDAPPAAMLLERFRDWVADDWMAAHDAHKAAGVLAFEAARHAVEMPEAPILDSLELARRRLPDAPDHSLESLCGLFEFEGDFEHRALSEAVYCWKVIEALSGEGAGVSGSDAGSPEGSSSLLAASGSPVTIPSAAPAEPILKTRHRRLVEALKTGSGVQLTYGSKDRAPSNLPVLPRLLYRRGKVSYMEAECSRSGLLKTYRLDRIHRVAPLR